MSIYGDLDSHISVLIPLIESLNNDKIDGKHFKKYNLFLQTIKNISLELTKIQTSLSDEKKKKFNPIIESIIKTLKGIVNTLITKIEIIVEKSKSINEDVEFLNEMNEEVKHRDQIDQELFSKIKTTENAALDRYLISILGSNLEPGIKTQYPWTFYVSTITDLKSELRDVFIDGESKNSEEIKRNYVHNFEVILKKIYFTTKTNVRNISMLRLSDLSDLSDKLKSYKTILEKLLFTLIDNDEFVSGDYNSLLSTYTSHTTSLSKLLGGDNYKRLIHHILDDGKSFLDTDGNPTLTTKTETLLKYILLAVQNITFVNMESYTKFYDAIVVLIENVIDANINIAQLSSIVDVSSEVTDLQVKHNRINNIYTFIKIRADKVNGLVETNQRYKIGLDKHRQIMYLGNDPTPESIYDHTLSLKNEYKYLSSDENVLPNNYLFGPFSYIFKPSDDNNIISNHESMSPLLEKLKTGKSVCVIGYGTSGSGKTSSLVYSDFEQTQDKRNGVLIHFCNLLRSTYGEIEVSFLEMEGNINEDSSNVVSNFKIIPIPEGDDKLLNEDNSFKYSDDDRIRQLYYKERSFIVESNEWVMKENSNLEDVKGVQFSQGLNIGKYIVTIMDNKRSIKATTNNPQSSRSHMIIFVKFKNKKSQIAGEKEPYLIICDFAGVENKFQCKNEEVLSLFEDIKTSQCKDKSLSKNECKDFEEFYNVKSEIKKRLHSKEAMYIPEMVFSRSLSDEFMRASLFSLIKDKNKIKIYEPIMKHITPIIIDIFNTSQSLDNPSLLVGDFLDALINLENIVTSYNPTLEGINIALSNKNLEIENWIKKLWSLFNISNSTKLVQLGKSPTHRHVKTFIFDLYVNNLRSDDFAHIYNSAMDELKKKYQFAMPESVKREIVEKTKKTLKSPVFDFIIEYSRLVFLEMDNNNSMNKEIVQKINRKNMVLDEIYSSRTQMLTKICNERVKEGLFINDSLLYLRNFISSFVINVQNNGKKSNPKFVDECAPLQCNPNYEDCFGSNKIIDKNMINSSVIANKIRERLCDVKGMSNICEDFRDISFCIFNVINLSKNANNPPPIPYIDISNLMNELNRLESIKTMTSISNTNKINDDSISKTVHHVYLDDLKNSNLFDESFPGSLKGVDKDLVFNTINILEEYNKNPPNDVNIMINGLKLLIDVINNTNSLTLIGTLEFTDMISKYGLNKTTCNYRFNSKYNDKLSSKLNGKHLLDFVANIGEYKGFILNLHNKYNEGVID